MCSRRHARPRAYTDGVREHAVASAHYRQAKILPAKMIHSTAREPASIASLLSARTRAAQPRAHGRPHATHGAPRQPRGNRRRSSVGVPTRVGTPVLRSLRADRWLSASRRWECDTTSSRHETLQGYARRASETVVEAITTRSVRSGPPRVLADKVVAPPGHDFLAALATSGAARVRRRPLQGRLPT